VERHEATSLWKPLQTARSRQHDRIVAKAKAIKNTLFSLQLLWQPMGMFGLLAAVAPQPARPIRPSGAADSSQKTRFVPTHARFVTFRGREAGGNSETA
jgi:hypothetical protein